MRKARSTTNRAARRRHLEPKAPPVEQSEHDRLARMRLPWVSGWVLGLLMLVPVAGVSVRVALDDLRWFEPGNYWRHVLAALAILLAFEVFKESAWRRRQRGVHWARFAAGTSAGLMVGIGYSPQVGGVLMAMFIGILVGLAFDLVVRE